MVLFLWYTGEYRILNLRLSLYDNLDSVPINFHKGGGGARIVLDLTIIQSINVCDLSAATCAILRFLVGFPALFIRRHNESWEDLPL